MLLWSARRSVDEALARPCPGLRGRSPAEDSVPRRLVPVLRSSLLALGPLRRRAPRPPCLAGRRLRRAAVSRVRSQRDIVVLLDQLIAERAWHRQGTLVIAGASSVKSGAVLDSIRASRGRGPARRAPAPWQGVACRVEHRHGRSRDGHHQLQARAPAAARVVTTGPAPRSPRSGGSRRLLHAHRHRRYAMMLDR